MAHVDPHPEFAPMLDECKKLFSRIWSLSLPEFKAAWLAPPPLGPEIPSLSDIHVSTKLIPMPDSSRIEIQVYAPKEVSGALPMLFVTHGGGWTVGSHSIEEGMNRSVCVPNRCAVVSVDYRMASEYPFPYAVNDSWEALNWCRNHPEELGIDPDRIILAGGSAGGNLAAVLALRARDEGLPGIIGQVLNLPVTCHPKLFPRAQYVYTSFEENRDAPIVDADKMDWFWNRYLPDVEESAYHSPLLAESFAGLPPALIQIAGMDCLRDEGLAYGEALRRAGVPVQIIFHAGVPPGFMMYPQLSHVTVYHQSIVDWVREILR